MDSKNLVTAAINELADNILDGDFSSKIRIGLTTVGSEHGFEVMKLATDLVKSNYPHIELVIIGEEIPELEYHPAADLAQAHKIMEKLLDAKEIDGCVTLHYDFPIGVSTIGKVDTPVMGKELFIANTTGTSAINRVEAMVLNAISGIATAKSNGINNPTVGILNIEGARKVEKILKSLQTNGYEINFAESLRADGGCVMRGNDLLAATPDVMVCDSLTGNIVVKLFSSFTSGGSYETTGSGYGPGVNSKPELFNKLIGIISRASGAPQIAKAILYLAKSAKGNVISVANAELMKAKSCNLDSIIADNIVSKTETNNITAPPKEIVTHQISGIDILEIETVCQSLWEKGIYAETGMGCTGPVILVNTKNAEKAEKIISL